MNRLETLFSRKFSGENTPIHIPSPKLYPANLTLNFPDKRLIAKGFRCLVFFIVYYAYPAGKKFDMRRFVAWAIQQNPSTTPTPPSISRLQMPDGEDEQAEQE
jgi:hypothetical protein